MNLRKKEIYYIIIYLLPENTEKIKITRENKIEWENFKHCKWMGKSIKPVIQQITWKEMESDWDNGLQREHTLPDQVSSMREANIKMKWKELQVDMKYKQTIIFRWMNKIIQRCMKLSGTETWIWIYLFIKKYEAKD